MDDDEYNGDLGEDDEEMPMIRTKFIVAEGNATIKEVTESVKTTSQITVTSKISSTINAGAASPRGRNTLSLGVNERINMDGAASPTARTTKRKTDITESGTKKIMRETTI